MNNDVIKKTTEKRVFLSDKEQHQKISKIALIMSLIPILSQFIAFFKVHYTVSHLFGIVNILCILCSFVLSILCIKNRENRNLMNIFSMILSGLFMVIIAVIAFAVVVYAVKG